MLDHAKRTYIDSLREDIEIKLDLDLPPVCKSNSDLTDQQVQEKWMDESQKHMLVEEATGKTWTQHVDILGESFVFSDLSPLVHCVLLFCHCVLLFCASKRDVREAPRPSHQGGYPAHDTMGSQRVGAFPRSMDAE